MRSQAFTHLAAIWNTPQWVITLWCFFDEIDGLKVTHSTHKHKKIYCLRHSILCLQLNEYTEISNLTIKTKARSLRMTSNFTSVLSPHGKAGRKELILKVILKLKVIFWTYSVTYVRADVSNHITWPSSILPMHISNVRMDVFAKFCRYLGYLIFADKSEWTPLLRFWSANLNYSPKEQRSSVYNYFSPHPLFVGKRKACYLRLVAVRSWLKSGWWIKAENWCELIRKDQQ